MKYIKNINESTEKKYFAVIETTSDNKYLSVSLYSTKEDLENYIINCANEMKQQPDEVNPDDIFFVYEDALNYLNHLNSEGDYLYFIREVPVEKKQFVDPEVVRKRDANKFGI